MTDCPAYRQEASAEVTVHRGVHPTVHPVQPPYLVGELSKSLLRWLSAAAQLNAGLGTVPLSPRLIGTLEDKQPREHFTDNVESDSTDNTLEHFHCSLGSDGVLNPAPPDAPPCGLVPSPSRPIPHNHFTYRISSSGCIDIMPPSLDSSYLAPPSYSPLGISPDDGGLLSNTPGDGASVINLGANFHWHFDERAFQRFTGAQSPLQLPTFPSRLPG
jgi:hypothetical protein